MRIAHPRMGAFGGVTVNIANQQAKIATMNPRLQLDLFLYPGAMAGTVLSLIDLVRSVNMVARLQQADAGPVIAWRLLDAQAQPLSLTDALFGCYQSSASADAPGPGTQRACFVPPLHAHNVPMVRQESARWPALTAYLGQAFDEGHQVATVGNGAWPLARSGRLGGRRLTLPWFYLAAFAQDFPDIGLAAEHPTLADGPLLSASGTQALTALGLELIASATDAELAQACGNAFRHDSERQRMTAQAAAHIPSTRDSVLARAIDWMNAHLDQPYRLDEVALAAAASPRTLLRHFQQVLGMTPLDYLRRLRCKRARILLEITLDSVPTIAEACGYADPAAFRRMFIRHEGLTPSQYRERFALRASRERWKVEDPAML